MRLVGEKAEHDLCGCVCRRERESVCVCVDMYVSTLRVHASCVC